MYSKHKRTFQKKVTKITMSYIIRIDDRLIHGQVVEGWLKPLRIDTLVVCSDNICNDPISKTLFEISVPRNVKLKCLSIETTATEIVEGIYDARNVLILISSLNELYNLVKKVLEKKNDYSFPMINIGGIRYIPGRKQIYKALYLNQEDFKLINSLISMNIKLEYSVLPNDEKIILKDKIDKIKQILEEI